MKIKHITPIFVRLPLVRPMKMAGAVIDVADNLLVRIESDDGRVGWGEAASAPTMTGDLVPAMAQAVAYLAPGVLGAPLGSMVDVHTINTRLHGALYGNQGAKAAIDMALHDLLGQHLQCPISALLATPLRAQVPALWMLGTGSEEADVQEARDKLASGVVAFKIKVGVGDELADAKRTQRVSAALCQGQATPPLVCADANQGWSHEHAARYLNALGDARLDFLEQPLPAQDLAGMRALSELAAARGTAIGCDEGIHDSADITRHHAHAAASGCSLKLIKLGGLQDVLAAGQLCQRLGMQVNLACKIAESSIASAAVLHLAATLPSMNWGLSLSHQYLADDLVRAPPPVLQGHVQVPTGVGLGVQVLESQVERYRVALPG